MNVVTSKATHSLGKPGECCYCHQPVGGAHKDDCISVKKMVRIKMVVEYEVPVPNHWTKKDVEFNRNDGTWCADNALDELEKIIARDGCLCLATRFECLTDSGEPFLDE